MMLGWASACPNFFDFGGENLRKGVDKIYAIAYNNNRKGEKEIPENKRGGHEKWKRDL